MSNMSNKEGNQSLPPATLTGLNKQPTMSPLIHLVKDDEKTSPHTVQNPAIVSTIKAFMARLHELGASDVSGIHAALLCDVNDRLLRLQFVLHSTRVPSFALAKIPEAIRSFEVTDLDAADVVIERAKLLVVEAHAFATKPTALAKEFMRGLHVEIEKPKQDKASKPAQREHKVYITSGEVNELSRKQVKNRPKIPVAENIGNYQRTVPNRAAHKREQVAAAKARPRNLIASYRMRIAAREPVPKEQKFRKIYEERNHKSSVFDKLTGIVPQVGFSFEHGVSQEVRDMVSDVIVNFREAIQGASYTVSAASGGVESAVDRLKDTVDNAQSSFGKLAEHAVRFAWVVPLLAVTYYAVTRVDTFKTKSAVLCVTAALATLLPAGLWDSIKSLWPQGEDADDAESFESAEPQSGFFEPANLAHIISLSMTFLTFNNNDKLGLTERFAKSVIPYSRLVDSWSKLSSFIISIVEKFINFIREQTGQEAVVIHNTGVKIVDAWCTKVLQTVHASRCGEGDVMTPESVQNIMALHREGTDLCSIYRFSSDVSSMLHKYLGNLKELTSLCQAAVYSFKGGRPQPATLCLTGEPGVGKTFLCKYIVSDILSEFITKERAEELDYNLDCEAFMKGDSEYWNGYAGQFCTIVDDFGQSVPVAGAENDFINLIRMANCWSYPLNFADLENKGKNFFRSSFILLTTNIDNLNNAQKVIAEPEAVARRIDFGYKITVAEDFKLNGTLDIAKVTQYIEEHGKLPYHAWVLYKHQFGVGSNAITDMTKNCSLEYVLCEIANKIRSNRTIHVDNGAHIKSMLKEKYESQGGTFEEFLTKPVKDTVKLICLAKGQFDKIYAKLQNTYESLKVGFADYCSYLSKLIANPIVGFCFSAAAVAMLLMICRSAITQVSEWFKPKNKKVTPMPTRLQRSKPLRDALDALTGSDFLNGEKYEFTPEAFLRAYHRLSSDSVWNTKDHLGDGPVEGLAQAYLDAVRPQSNVPGAMRLDYRVVRTTGLIESDAPIKPQADSYGNEIGSIAAQSLYSLEAVGLKGRLNLGHVLMVRDACALVPLHFDAHILSNIAKGNLDLKSNIVLTHGCNRSNVFTFGVQAFLDMPRHKYSEDDCMFVNFSTRNLRSHRDIGHLFIRERDLTNLSKVRVRLDTVKPFKQSAFMHTRSMAATRVDERAITGEGENYTLAKSYEYLGYTEYGDCGGVVCTEETPHLNARRILGVHVAGNPSLGLGFSNIVTQEKVQAATKALGLLTDVQFQCNQSAPVAPAPVAGSFSGLHKACASKPINPASSLRRTPLYGLWGAHPKRPMPHITYTNKDGETIVPMANALKPYGTPVLTYDDKLVKRAAFHAFSNVNQLTRDASREIYSFDEAVTGRPGEFKGMPRGTSPGYPFVFEGHTTKKKFFGSGVDYDLTGPECDRLRLLVRQVEEDAKQGIRSEHIFMDFLKDELRSEKKIQAGLARLISSAPLVYNVVFRQYFLAFVNAVQGTRVRNGVAVGINPYTEWNYLARKLQSKGKKLVAGDFTSFDSSEQPQIHWAILDSINDWYNDGPVNALVRRVLWMEVVHSRHCGGVDGKVDTIYQWNKSLPSGHPATSIINSFYNLIIFHMVWTDVMGVAYAASFWEHVYICVFGDDNILNISDEVVDRFNQNTIEASMAKFGMTYTAENKESGVAAFRSLSEVSFLKRGFRFEPLLGEFVGPQELDSILYIPYWARNQAQLTAITEANMELTFAELSLHGDEEWNARAFDMRAKYTEVMQVSTKQYFTREEYVNYAMRMELPWL